jgi:hypothetical protein
MLIKKKISDNNNILEQWIVTDILKCSSAQYDQTTLTPRHTLYPTGGIVPSSRRKSDILFEHNPLPLSSHKNINPQKHMITNYFHQMNATNSTAS